MLFAYGTLQFGPVLHALLGRVPPLDEAELPGWRAAALRGRSYPGLVPGPGARGVVLDGLTAGEWAVLDAFEEDVYVRQEVTLADGRTAWTYVWPDASAVLPHDWSADEFARTDLQAFVRRLTRE
jgi:gamma-glutamylcyclotransferase (GGCT)/AIG2-like uncharacterized protein YtfP